MIFLWQIEFYFVIFRIEELNTGNSITYGLSMKNRCQQIIFLVILMLSASAIGAFAQEAGMSDGEMVGERDVVEDKVTFVPGEDVRYTPRATGMVIAKDSIVLQMTDFPMQRAAQKATDKSSEKQGNKSKDDSILTFNFLYYIIQKYKLQDVID